MRHAGRGSPTWTDPITHPPCVHAPLQLTAISLRSGILGILPAPLLPQLIPRSLPSRQEMSSFLGRIRDFPKTSPRTEGDANADPTPAVFACANPLRRRDTCSCRARHGAPTPSAGGHAWVNRYRWLQHAHPRTLSDDSELSRRAC